MSTRRTYPAGVPCWVDTAQPDAEAARRFYGKLFGWTFLEGIASLDGQPVAGIFTGADVAWNTYVAVDDADAVAATIASAGGAVISDTECADPGGARFRLWQERDRPSAQVVNVSGAWNFSDLHTSDVPAAKEFYAAVFGWEAAELDFGATMWRMPGYGDHLEATVDPDIRSRQAAAPAGFEDAIAWLAPLAPGEPGPGPHWHVTFTVADRDNAVAVAQRLGAEVISSSETMWTRSAVIRDPQGADLTLSQFTPPDDWG
jgi:predicted enzyme related to lactoylglutathione lyase